MILFRHTASVSHLLRKQMTSSDCHTSHVNTIFCYNGTCKVYVGLRLVFSVAERAFPCYPLFSHIQKYSSVVDNLEWYPGGIFITVAIFVVTLFGKRGWGWGYAGQSKCIWDQQFSQ